jgi:hypothetical protein
MQVLAGGFKVSEGRYCSSGGFQGQEIRVQVGVLGMILEIPGRGQSSRSSKNLI